jgi:hypothetical protein
MSDPLSPTELGSFTQTTVDFNKAAQDQRPETQSTQQQSGSQSDAIAHQQLTEEQKELRPEMHLRPKDSELVQDVHKEVDLEAKRRAFMDAHQQEPNDLGPKL